METPSVADALRERVKAAGKSLDEWGKALKAIVKPLQDLAKDETLADHGALHAAMQKLQKLQLPAGELKTHVDGVVETLKTHLTEEERKLKFYFGRDLKDDAAKAGIPFAPLTTDPPEFRLGLFTVLVDMPKRQAVVRYARNDLERVAINPSAILDSVKRNGVRLEGNSFNPDLFFAQLLQAYQIRLHRLGQPFGTRVDIVDLLAEIAFVRQGPAFFEDPQRDNFVPYSKVQLAYDLSRLRRAGKLTHRGYRLGLGSATGGSTRQKSAVLYLEDERGNGQWYLSLKFSPESDAG